MRESTRRSLRALLAHHYDTSMDPDAAVRSLAPKYSHGRDLLEMLKDDPEGVADMIVSRARDRGHRFEPEPRRAPAAPAQPDHPVDATPHAGGGEPASAQPRTFEQALAAAERRLTSQGVDIRAAASRAPKG